MLSVAEPTDSVDFVALAARTGGARASRDALLQIGVVLVRNFRIVDGALLWVADRYGQVDPARVNLGSNSMQDHRRLAQSPFECLTHLTSMIAGFKTYVGPDGVSRAVMAGFKLDFVKRFLQRLGHIAGDSKWADDEFNRYTNLDVVQLMRTLAILGVAHGGEFTLRSLARSFGIVHDPAHGARSEAETVAKIVIKMRRAMQASGLSFDVRQEGPCE